MVRTRLPSHNYMPSLPIICHHSPHRLEGLEGGRLGSSCLWRIVISVALLANRLPPLFAKTAYASERNYRGTARRRVAFPLVTHCTIPPPTCSLGRLLINRGGKTHLGQRHGSPAMFGCLVNHSSSFDFLSKTTTRFRVSLPSRTRRVSRQAHTRMHSHR